MLYMYYSNALCSMYTIDVMLYTMLLYSMLYTIDVMLLLLATQQEVEGFWSLRIILHTLSLLY